MISRSVRLQAKLHQLASHPESWRDDDVDLLKHQMIHLQYDEAKRFAAQKIRVGKNTPEFLRLVADLLDGSSLPPIPRGGQKKDRFSPQNLKIWNNYLKFRDDYTYTESIEKTAEKLVLGIKAVERYVTFRNKIIEKSKKIDVDFDSIKIELFSDENLNNLFKKYFEEKIVQEYGTHYCNFNKHKKWVYLKYPRDAGILVGSKFNLFE